MNNFFKEPLVHFLLAGAVVFAVYGLVNDRTNAESKEERMVRISAGQVEWLKQTWARQKGRPPNTEELQGMVAGYLKEELLAREARELKLDEDDTIVRRRLAQKMDFMVQDTAQLAEPGEDELRQLLESHSVRFQTPARITFTHVFFNRDARGEKTRADALVALEQLPKTQTGSESEFGDRFLSQYDFHETEEQAVASVFGPEFARRIFTVPPGNWQGPLESGFGLHLVLVTKKEPARLPDFTTVRDDVVALWRQQQERESRERYFSGLLEKYEVVMDESVKSLIGPIALLKEKDQ
ncbi:MAG TPA: peptidylprolyl isomerase [Nitrospirales bacterium]|nr:peptidyl-prolyl cis-trans isomerase [Nitrospiraceae bacterium]HNP29069.1 peptidylprolyl isomerase [Nitrospirales bacterium]